MTISAMNIDDISKARIEEAVFTSPGMLSLRTANTISLKQEQHLHELVKLVSQLLQE